MNQDKILNKREADKHLIIMRKEIAEMKIILEKIVETINPLNGKGGIVKKINDLNLKVNILWGSFATLAFFIIKDWFTSK